MEVISSKLEEAGGEADLTSELSSLMPPLVNLATKEADPQNQQEPETSLSRITFTDPLSWFYQ